ncbi:D-alanyl-D-alanine carboxypeptidase family protein [Verrucomicrobium sp. 3C]|uniref:D-alanyl-D-alanine carboxypeptidase family protein n=1 Tax=Verrucomicrobium sp. 3C TaxID=1134055 RepID=UPI00037F3BB5|nr:serine hydrolase [Verrucomicrobium sp. 3C]
MARSAFHRLVLVVAAALWLGSGADLTAARHHRHARADSSFLSADSEWEADRLVEATAALLYDPIRNRVLFARNLDAPLAPASTTKLMTALLVYEQTGLRGFVTILPQDTAVEPSHVPLRIGQRVSVAELVQDLLVGSCNDAALALARSTAGSVPAFVHQMNRKAWEMGSLHTHFVDPHGLASYQEGQVTTAQDLLRIFQAVLDVPSLRQILMTRTVATRSGSQLRILHNHNRLLGKYEGMGPAKTGWTRAARHTYAAACQRDGHPLLLILLHSPDKWRDATVLFNYGFRQVKEANPPPASAQPL